MRKIVVLGLALAALWACGSKEAPVEKTVDEMGTEIVLNRKEPAKLAGAPADLELVEEWRLDTGDDATASFGLSDIGEFDIDAEGNVFFLADPSHEKAVLKFDASGRPAASFGRRGQGPGEIQRFADLYVTARDEVAVSNQDNSRLTVFDAGGTLVRETPAPSDLMAVAPLPNGSFLTMKRQADPRPDSLFEFPIELSGPDWTVREKLDTGFLENPMTGEKLRGTYHLQSWSVSRDKIFTGHQDRGYDIFVYDFEGRPVRKIRKEFDAVPVPEAHKKEFLDQFGSPQMKFIQDKVYFPSGMPPFIGFAADEESRLYVMTYETTGQPGEFIFDVFDADGVFILRKPIRVFQDYNGGFFKVRNGRFYCVEEDAEGQKLFIAYRMDWKQ
ncbi:MAG: hypothetical protein JW843_08850 [Candidatus Aminicenantes bacterium]|nr:hypothetical protein [Candidatus Aminicenantes bacterium]